MTTVHKISLIGLVFALFIILGAKPALASQESSDSFVPLKNLVLSNDEVRHHWRVSSDTLLYEYDVTSELADICFIDCAKVVWAYSNSRVNVKLTLVMIRSNNSENAFRSIESLWQTYKSLGSRFYPYDELTNRDNFWLGMMLYTGETPDSIGKQQYIATRTQGQITIMVFFDHVIRSFVADVDSAAYLALVDDLSRIQQQKLLDAGYEP
jgi:hypothetical protein